MVVSPLPLPCSHWTPPRWKEEVKAGDRIISEGDMQVKYLDKVSILDALLAEEKKQVANALVEMHFASEDRIIQQGEPGNMFYIMYEGDVDIDKDGEVATLSAKSKAGTVHFFGEMLGLIPLWGERLAENRTKIKRSDLKRIGLLGCGGFGAVELWEHSKTGTVGIGQTFALKAISKGYIVKTGMQEHCRRFYSSCVILAFEHMHQRRIIYRDLKPENLLLTEDGQLKEHEYIIARDTGGVAVAFPLGECRGGTTGGPALLMATLPIHSLEGLKTPLNAPFELTANREARARDAPGAAEDAEGLKAH
eukprot:Skav205049  [mRNA]  locus=scaffold6619:702:12084:+ [translate_table: standard]